MEILLFEFEWNNPLTILLVFHIDWQTQRVLIEIYYLGYCFLLLLLRAYFQCFIYAFEIHSEMQPFIVKKTVESHMPGRENFFH